MECPLTCPRGASGVRGMYHTFSASDPRARGQDALGLRRGGPHSRLHCHVTMTSGVGLRDASRRAAPSACTAHRRKIDIRIDGAVATSASIQRVPILDRDLSPSRSLTSDAMCHRLGLSLEETFTASVGAEGATAPETLRQKGPRQDISGK